LVLELASGELDWSRLTTCQRHATEGLYAQALAGYVHWLAPRYSVIRDSLRSETAVYRERVHSENLHARTPGIVADLAAGWHHWLDYALKAGALDQAERDALARRVWAALLEAAARQAEHVEAAEPWGHYLRLLAAALMSGRAHVADVDGGEPKEPAAWGWRKVEVGTGQYRRTQWDPQGKRVGWLDGPDLLLQPDAAYASAQQLAHEKNDSLSVSERVLRRRLWERGLLKTTGSRSGRVQLTVRRVIEGVRREVLHLAIDSIYAHGTTPITPFATSTEANGVETRGSNLPGQVSLPHLLPHASSGVGDNGVEGVVPCATNAPTAQDAAHGDGDGTWHAPYCEGLRTPFDDD
jgi:hypothetical protein